MENMEETQVEYWKDMENAEENSENTEEIMKRKISWIVKRFGKYRRKLWNAMKNTEEK
jgi:hypothetical protein